MRSNLMVEGCELSLESRGAGRPLIVVAGGPGLSCDYLSGLFALSDEHRLVLFDQPGCGRSTAPTPPSTDLTVACVKAVIASEAPHGDYTLVAHSWGAYVALQACRELANRPARTVLVNPVPFDRRGFDAIGARLVSRVQPEVMTRIAELSEIGTREAGAELMRLALPAYSGQDERLPDTALQFDIQTSNAVTTSLGDYDLHAEVAALGELTFVFGARDYIFASDFHDDAPDARRVELATGHFPMLEALDDLVGIIRTAAGS